ncbi:MAG: hypothetical protein DDT25_00902 [Chloroflexi bacterium]|nr:hypothetical protein [Chloroflexota bacterium]
MLGIVVIVLLGLTEVTFTEFLRELGRTHPVAATYLEEWIEERAPTVAYSPEELESVRRFRSQVAGGRMAVVNAVLARLWGMEVTLAEVLDHVARTGPLAAAYWCEVVPLPRLLNYYSPEELEVEWRGRPEDGISGISMRPRRVSPEGEDR